MGIEEDKFSAANVIKLNLTEIHHKAYLNALQILGTIWASAHYAAASLNGIVLLKSFSDY